jgi:hypothetical protein
MTRSRDAHHGPRTARQEPVQDAADERDIDQILADSFPASDAPPWTLGVTAPSQKSVRQRTAPRD